MLPASANGQPAVAAYYRSSDGTYLLYGIVVLTATAEGISRITAFGDPDLVAAFGFPAHPTSRAGNKGAFGGGEELVERRARGHYGFQAGLVHTHRQYV